MRRLLPDISPLVSNEPDCILVSRVLEGIGCSYILHDYLSLYCWDHLLDGFSDHKSLITILFLWQVF